MSDVRTAVTTGLSVPATLQEAIDPAWLAAALAPVSGGAAIADVTLTELVKAMAAKVRIAVRFANNPDRVHHYCVKGFLDSDQDPASTSAVTSREASFYSEIAPHISMRVPACPAVVTDASGRTVMIMEDVIAAGGQFCDTFSPFTVDQAQASLDQIARLHAASHLLQSNPWIPRGLEWMAQSRHFPEPRIDALMHDGRGEGLPEATLSGGNLLAALRLMAQQSNDAEQTLLHGDTHIANVYMTKDGPGFADWQLIKSASWAIDVAYHINCVLRVEVAEKHERELLACYLDALARHGGSPVPAATAWEEYCRATPYGLYLWAITTRVDPAKTKENFQRLGAAVTRCEAYQRLGVIN
jgi:aminoglycoside phosphotransferase (APT) family kinase protein